MVAEVAPGLWRWTAPHPAWRPGAEPGSAGDWDPNVGCILAVDGERAVFVDPLLPADEAAFWAWSDEAVGSRPVHVLTTIRFHGRSGEAFAARYGGAADDPPPDVGSVAFRAADETMFWIPAHGALIPGDRIIGDDAGGVRLCPETWTSYLKPPLSDGGLRAILRPLLDLPAERILVSHGEPLLSGGAAALQRILG